MKRGKKLLVLTLVLCLLAAAAAAASRLNPEGEETAGEETVIFTVDTGTVTKLSWRCQDQTLTFTRNGNCWSYEDPAFPVNQTNLDSLLVTLSELTASKTIADVEDLGEYGLDEAGWEIWVSDGAGEYHLTLGDETGVSAERYLSLGDGNVYLVDSAVTEKFSAGLYDLIQMEQIPDLSDMTRFTVRTAGGELDIAYEQSGDAAFWYLAADESKQALDEDKVAALTDLIGELSWNSCADYNAGAEALAPYGLAEPAVTVQVGYLADVEVVTDTLDTDGNPVVLTEQEDAVFTVQIGLGEDGGCYARLADSAMVYAIDTDVYDGLCAAETAQLQPEPEQTESTDAAETTGANS